MKYLTIKELAIYLRVSRPTIYLWIANNKIPYIRISTHIIRFDIAEIDAYMRNNKVE